MEDVFYAGGRRENIDKRRKTCAMLKTNKPPRGICAVADTRMKSTFLGETRNLWNFQYWENFIQKIRILVSLQSIFFI